MTNKRAARRTINVGLGALLAGALFLTISSVAAPAGASVGDPTPTAFDGARTCADLGYDIAYLINGQPTNGQHGTITVSNLELVAGRLEFDWTSSQLWNAVIVRHEGSLVYEYDPARNNDQNVQTVSGANSGDISQVRFCAARGGTTTTSSAPTTSSSTTTSSPTSSSTTTSSTTTSSTTTSSTTTSSTTTSSTIPSTSSSTPPTVLDTVITRPGTAVMGADTLPRTGNDTGWLAAAGAGLVLVGSTFLLIGGRRARLQ